MLDPDPNPGSGTWSGTVMHSGSGSAKAKSYGSWGCGSGSATTTLPEGQPFTKKIRKVKKFHVLKCWMFSFEGMLYALCYLLSNSCFKKNTFNKIFKLQNFL